MRVEADVETARADLGFPDTLFWEFDGIDPPPEGWADGPLVALLPIAMTIGESVEVRGSLSTKLRDGLDGYQHIAHEWWPELFDPVELIVDRTEARTRPGPPRVVTPFSGGVDSTTTLLRRRPAAETDVTRRLTHALTIDGFDRDVSSADDDPHFAGFRALYEPFLREEGIALLVVRSNLQRFRRAAFHPRELPRSFGTALFAAALAAGPTFSTCLAPSSFGDARAVPDGCHPDADPLFGTEALEVVVDGGELTRVGKTELLAAWEPAWTRLRTCLRKTPFDGSCPLNCGGCSKCLRSMTTLDLLGALDRFPVYPALTLGALLRPRMLGRRAEVFRRENLALAAARGRRGRTLVLRIGGIIGRITTALLRPVLRRRISRVRRRLRVG